MDDDTPLASRSRIATRGRARWMACLLVGLSACGRLGFNAELSQDAAMSDDGSVDGAVADGATDGPTTREMTPVGGLSALPAGKLDLGATGSQRGSR